MSESNGKADGQRGTSAVGFFGYVLQMIITRYGII